MAEGPKGGRGPSDPAPDPNHRAPTAETAAGQERHARGTLRIQDFGDEVHLWIEQRVSWEVALEILRILKAPNPPEEIDKP